MRSDDSITASRFLNRLSSWSIVQNKLDGLTLVQYILEYQMVFVEEGKPVLIVLYCPIYGYNHSRMSDYSVVEQ